jgi:hypothetical protein
LFFYLIFFLSGLPETPKKEAVQGSQVLLVEGATREVFIVFLFFGGGTGMFAIAAPKTPPLQLPGG